MGLNSVGYNSQLYFSCFSIPKIPKIPQLIKEKQNKKESYQKNIIKQSLENGLIKQYNFWEGCTRAKIYLKQFLCLFVRKHFDTKLS